MKKSLYFFIISISVLLLSCQQRIDMEIIDSTGSVSEITLPGDITRAAPTKDNFMVSRTEAENYVKIVRGEDRVLSSDPIVIDRDTVAWLFNFTRGWMALSGDKRIQPVLGQSETEHFDFKRGSNEYLANWILSCGEAIRTLRSVQDISENEHTKLWDFIDGVSFRNERAHAQIKTRVDPDYRWAVFLDQTYSVFQITGGTPNHLVTTKWGQGSPWNEKLPYHIGENGSGGRCLTGCIPVAMGQLIKYYKGLFNMSLGLYHTVGCSKTTIDAQTEDVGFYHSDYQENSLRWNQMALTSSSSDIAIEYAGDIMLELGNRLSISYSSSESGNFQTPTYYILRFSGYNLTCSSGSYLYATVKNNLDSNLPIMISAWSNGGHFWIIDGYREKTEYYTNCYRLEYTNDYSDAIATYTDDDIEDVFGEYYSDGMEWEETISYAGGNYLLMNWGDNGNGDDGEYYVVPGQQWGYYSSPTIYYSFHKNN